MRVVAEFSAQLRDAAINRTIHAVVVDATQVVEDIVAAQHAPGISCQQQEKFELVGRQRHELFIELHFLGRRTDPQLAECYVAALRCRCAGIFDPPQQRPRPGEQHHRIDRLCNIVVSSCFEANHLVDIGVARREDQDRSAEGLPQLPTDREAVESGEHQVEEHDPWPHPGELRKRPVAALLDYDGQAVLFEVLRR